MTQWKTGYLLIIVLYLCSVTSFFILSYRSLSTDQLISITIASIALLISLIQMAESNKRKRPIHCTVRLWGKKKGRDHHITLKFINLDRTAINDFKFRLKMPKGIFRPAPSSAFSFQFHGYGKTDVVQCDDLDFLGGRGSGFNHESLEMRFHLSKSIPIGRVVWLVLTASNLAPVQLKLTSDQLQALKENHHSSEDKALLFG